MATLAGEKLILFPEAVAYIADRTGGRKPHLATLHRWATRGVRGVVLESVAVGHTRYTSVPAVERFMAATPAAPAPSPARRRTTGTPTVRRSDASERLMARAFTVRHTDEGGAR